MAPLDPHRVLASPDARTAVEAFARHLRAAGFGPGEPVDDDDPAVVLAQGLAVPAADLRRTLGPEVVDALVDAGVLAVQGDEAVPATRVLPVRSILTLLPANHDDLDVVYLGQDSIALFREVWRRGGIGRRAADLGTGNGMLAAALATRFDHVVAVDLSLRCAATAATATVLNPHLRTRLSAVQADVAAGLREGAFDLVVANAPWVPEVADVAVPGSRRFAAGGPTGVELPARFVRGAAALLAPGGRAFIACLDPVLADGRRPLAEHLDRLPDGVDVEVGESGLEAEVDWAEWVAARIPGAVSARHVIVVLRRPG